TKRPSGVTTFQQFAAPNVGTPALIGSSFPLEVIEYEDIVELFGPEPPVSETINAPLRAKSAENVPGDTAGFTVICDRLPSACTLNTSMLFVVRSVTAR